MDGETAAPPAPKRSERRVTFGIAPGSAALGRCGRRWRRRRWRWWWCRAGRRDLDHRTIRARLRRRGRRRRWWRRRGRGSGVSAEALANDKADSPRRTDIVADARPEATLTVERQLR